MENEETKKTVEFSITFNGVDYDLKAVVDTESEEVEFDSDEDLSFSVYYNGYYVARAFEIAKPTALHEADCSDDIYQCAVSGYYFFEDDMVTLHDDRLVIDSLAQYFDRNDSYYYVGDFEEHRFRDGSDSQYYMDAPEEWWEEQYYCDQCDCYISYDDYYGDGICVFCHDEEEEEDSIIEEYCESHHHSPIFFGDYDGEFAGLGFELEVDANSSRDRQNEEVASSLCDKCGLEYDEMRYAHDGSLNYGFEIISQPHTIKDFWDKSDKWQKMLKYLADEGYKSHDGGTCGLHVHVSRTMFGKTHEEQERAIAKVYTFFDENWDDIVIVSRRKSFCYCEKNTLDSGNYGEPKYRRWKKQIKDFSEGGHHVALNNCNRSTFEYRLGRGTLNSWSFFSWIDFVLTITKNAKRINLDKVETNDKLSWLGGIKESTAKYIYKRGAFRNEMVALYPNIEWETDLTESNNN